MYGNNHVSSLSPCPYAVRSVHMRSSRPCLPAAYVPTRLLPSPHLHGDDADADDDDTVHSDAQYRRRPSLTPSLKNLHPMTHQTALVYGRYNKLGTDAIKHLAFCFKAHGTYFSTSSFQVPHCLQRPRPTPHVGRCVVLPEDAGCPQGEQAPRQGSLALTHRAAQRHFGRRAPCANPPVT
jgi:hypothetical protein